MSRRVTRKDWIAQGNNPDNWAEAPIEREVLEAMQDYGITLPMVAALDQLAERTVLYNQGFPPDKRWETLNGNVVGALQRRGLVYKLDEGAKWSPLLLSEKGKEIATRLGYMAKAETALREKIALENWRDYAIDNRQRVENMIREVLPDGCKFTLQARALSWMVDVMISTLTAGSGFQVLGGEYRVEKVSYQSDKPDHYRLVVRHAPLNDWDALEHLRFDADKMMQVVARLNREMQEHEPKGAYNGGQ